LRHSFEKDMGGWQMSHVRIIATGGGGFTHESYPQLDDFCLAQVGKPAPKVGFIGTASRDDPTKVARFHARFADVTGMHVHLAMDLTARDLAERMQGLDLVYVGGGNTEAMVAEWRAAGWDKVLVAAARRGVVLAGVSAGAVCWFDRFLYHSGTGPMRPLAGLGLIAGGACPHYSTEPDRRAALQAAVRAGTMPDSLALDDGAAVLMGVSGPLALCSSAPGAGACHVRQDGQGGVTETPLNLSEA
jgi:peptidase E